MSLALTLGAVNAGLQGIKGLASLLNKPPDPRKNQNLLRLSDDDIRKMQLRNMQQTTQAGLPGLNATKQMVGAGRMSAGAGNAAMQGQQYQQAKAIGQSGSNLLGMQKQMDSQYFDRLTQHANAQGNNIQNAITPGIDALGGLMGNVVTQDMTTKEAAASKSSWRSIQDEILRKLGLLENPQAQYPGFSGGLFRAPQINAAPGRGLGY